MTQLLNTFEIFYIWIRISALKRVNSNLGVVCFPGTPLTEFIKPCRPGEEDPSVAAISRSTASGARRSPLPAECNGDDGLLPPCDEDDDDCMDSWLPTDFRLDDVGRGDRNILPKKISKKIFKKKNGNISSWFFYVFTASKNKTKYIILTWQNDGGKSFQHNGPRNMWETICRQSVSPGKVALKKRHSHFDLRHKDECWFNPVHWGNGGCSP